MEKFFNTAGPNKINKHYCVPMLERFDLTELENFIDQEKYFLLHAPRQTGKTSCMLALADYLNTQGRRQNPLMIGLSAGSVNVSNG